MANVRIRNATDIVTLNPTDAVPVGRALSSVNYKATVTEIQTAVLNPTALPAKAVPLGADLLIVGDSTASGAAAQSTVTQIQTAMVTTTAVNAALSVNAFTTKTTPVLADEFIIGDSAVSFASKKVTGSQLLSLFGPASGTVSSVAVASPGSTLSISGSPITTTGTINLDVTAVPATTLQTINSLTTKTTPVVADEFIIGDSAASFANKKVTGTALQALFGGGVSSVAVSSTGNTLGITGSPITASGTINADLTPGTMTAKGTPVLADLVVIGDSAASNAPKTSTLTQVQSAVVTTAASASALGLGALSTGIVKVTTGTGALTTAIAADFPTLNQNTSGSAASFTGTLAGDVTGTQGVTVVSGVGGQTAAAVAAAAVITPGLPLNSILLNYSTNQVLTNPMPDVIILNPSMAALTVTMPPANVANSQTQQTVYQNESIFSTDIHTSGGGGLATIVPNAVTGLSPTSHATAAGTWKIVSYNDGSAGGVTAVNSGSLNVSGSTTVTIDTYTAGTFAALASITPANDGAIGWTTTPPIRWNWNLGTTTWTNEIVLAPVASIAALTTLLSNLTGVVVGSLVPVLSQQVYYEVIAGPSYVLATPLQPQANLTAINALDVTYIPVSTSVASVADNGLIYVLVSKVGAVGAWRSLVTVGGVTYTPPITVDVSLSTGQPIFTVPNSYFFKTLGVTYTGVTAITGSVSGGVGANATSYNDISPAAVITSLLTTSIYVPGVLGATVAIVGPTAVINFKTTVQAVSGTISVQLYGILQ